VIIEPNPVFLDANGDLARQPERPDLARPEDFWEGFDQFGLFYDVFRDVDSKRVWFVGPDPKNLLSSLKNCTVTGKQSGHVTKFEIVVGHENLAACVVLPKIDRQFTLKIAGQQIEGEIGENLCDLFKDKRVLLTLNKDNDLNWIKDWATFYAKEHGADAVCIFDNGSSSYDATKIAKTLEMLPNISAVQVVRWSFIFGVMDKVGQDNGLNQNVRFAQPPMFLSFCLRLGHEAASILNVDIDELVFSPSRRSIFEEAERRFFGTVKFDRFLVENVRNDIVVQSESDFQGFHYRNKKHLGRQDHLRKWAIAPSKLRLTKVCPMPWTHRVYGILNPYPASKEFRCYHFAGINTGWRAKIQKGEKFEWQHKRSITSSFDPELHVADKILAARLDEIFG
jgi:hypothetical protein